MGVGGVGVCSRHVTAGVCGGRGGGGGVPYTRKAGKAVSRQAYAMCQGGPPSVGVWGV